MLPRAIAVAALHKKYFSAFCASCYCARRVLISSQRRHQTLQTDAAREEMHLCAMHKRALFAAAAAAAATEFFLSTISLCLLRWIGIISMRRRKSKANDFGSVYGRFRGLAVDAIAFACHLLRIIAPKILTNCTLFS
jgi:hypothetical protein